MPNSLICVDASLIVRLMVDAADDRLPAQWKAWSEREQQIVAPTLLYYEVANALYQYQRQQYLAAELAEQALAASLSLPIRLYGDSGLHLSAKRFAERFALSATYDAHYLALADRLGAEFWSADRRLAEKVQAQLDWMHLYT
jgi:predicted nucleic acid-binding protein